jgi:hypothetical protein
MQITLRSVQTLIAHHATDRPGCSQQRKHATETNNQTTNCRQIAPLLRHVCQGQRPPACTVGRTAIRPHARREQRCLATATVRISSSTDAALPRRHELQRADRHDGVVCRASCNHARCHDAVASRAAPKAPPQCPESHITASRRADARGLRTARRLTAIKPRIACAIAGVRVGG